MAKTFWELMEDYICDECGGGLLETEDEGTFYCKNCQIALTLCGTYGTCDGIAHDYPYHYIAGILVETHMHHGVGGGWCNSCRTEWEWA